MRRDRRTASLDFWVERSKAGGLVAVCACGWTSVPHRAAGVVGALWDRHVEDDHRPVAVALKG